MMPIIYLMIRDTDFEVHYYLKGQRHEVGIFTTIDKARAAVRAVRETINGT
jgi:hypothetical protein